MTDSAVTATDLIRNAVRIFRQKAHLAPLARDAQTSVAALECFLDQSARLPADVLGRLTSAVPGPRNL